jgi:hypothetical protein
MSIILSVEPLYARVGVCCRGRVTVVQGHVAIFTLNRPKARNAVNLALSQRMETVAPHLSDLCTCTGFASRSGTPVAWHARPLAGISPLAVWRNPLAPAVRLTMSNRCTTCHSRAHGTPPKPIF